MQRFHQIILSRPDLAQNLEQSLDDCVATIFSSHFHGHVAKGPLRLGAVEDTQQQTDNLVKAGLRGKEESFASFIWVGFPEAHRVAMF
jgi:hypothetical protein